MLGWSGGENQAIRLDTVIAVITEGGVIRLGLEPGTEVLTMVKAPSVMLGHDIKRGSLSARNVLMGTIARIVPEW